MKSFFVRWLAMTLACGIMCWLLPGAHVIGSNKFLAYGAFALFMALINASIKPIIQFLAIPVTFLTLGIASILINVAMAALASAMATGVFGVGVVFASFWWALLGAVILAILSDILSSLLGSLS